MVFSGVWGPVAAAGPEFPEVEKAVRDGMLGYAASIAPITTTGGPFTAIRTAKSS